MANTITLENQNGEIYYRDFHDVSGYTFLDSKIKIEGVHHQEDRVMIFYIHGISFDNEAQGKSFAELLNTMLKEKVDNVLYTLITAIATYQPEYKRKCRRWGVVRYPRIFR